MEHITLIIILSIVFGFFMAYGIGANDVANAMGTSVGAKALTLKQAIIVAAIFEAAGAFLAGGEVTETIRNQIINPFAFSHTPELLAFGMLAALLAAGIWLLVASYFGWPVSTTHSIVGAIIGFGLVSLGVHAIHWPEVVQIVLSWIITPFIAATIAYGIFLSIQKIIIDTEKPFQNAKRYVPIYIFAVTLVICLVTFFKGLKPLGLAIQPKDAIITSIIISLAIMLLSYGILTKVSTVTSNHLGIQHASVEKVFGVLMIFTASSMAFSHGSNDVANAVGPLAAVIAIVKTGGLIATQAKVPLWIMSLGALGIVIGLMTIGYRVIKTVGSKITMLTPSRGFAAEFATATTVILASGTGLPVSTTQTLVGAILGVGLARGIGSLNLRVVGNIFMSWIITIPTGAILTIIIYYIFKVTIL